MDDYSMQKHMYYIAEARKIIESDLPPFCAEYFRSISNQTTPLTRYVYATDLRLFFNYIINENAFFRGKTVHDIVPSDLEQIKPVDIELFLEYVSMYEREITADDGTVSSVKLTVNMENAKARKLAAVRSMFKFLYKREFIKTSPAAIVETPKIHEKPIVRLEQYEVDDLFKVIENADGMTERQKKHLARTRTRDIAIITLFLGTGIRISELVGINIDDINFVSDEFCITRKGGKKDVLVFGEEVKLALLEYLKEREKITPAVPEDADALFLSSQRRRITVRAVENLVKKYAEVAVPQKHITPHKLRSTFGTELYSATGDIYLVADVLGHKDVNTTRKHYAEVAKQRRRTAADVIKVHGDDENANHSSDEAATDNKNSNNSDDSGTD